jgi:hypothetical protein
MCLRKAWLYQVQSLLHNFHMLPQVQLRLFIYPTSTSTMGRTQQGSNKREQETVRVTFSQAHSHASE